MGILPEICAKTNHESDSGNRRIPAGQVKRLVRRARTQTGRTVRRFEPIREPHAGQFAYAHAMISGYQRLVLVRIVDVKGTMAEVVCACGDETTTWIEQGQLFERFDDA